MIGSTGSVKIRLCFFGVDFIVNLRSRSNTLGRNLRLQVTEPVTICDRLRLPLPFKVTSCDLERGRTRITRLAWFAFRVSVSRSQIASLNFNDPLFRSTSV